MCFGRRNCPLSGSTLPLFVHQLLVTSLRTTRKKNGKKPVRAAPRRCWRRPTGSSWVAAGTRARRLRVRVASIPGSRRRAPAAATRGRPAPNPQPGETRTPNVDTCLRHASAWRDLLGQRGRWRQETARETARGGGSDRQTYRQTEEQWHAPDV